MRLKHTVNEMILNKLDKKPIDENLKKFIKEILESERRRIVLRDRFFKDEYEKLISKYLLKVEAYAEDKESHS